MEYRCPVCGEKVERELLKITSHQDQHIVEEIKKDHPDWIEGDGLCKKCYQYYKDQLKSGE